MHVISDGQMVEKIVCKFEFQCMVIRHSVNIFFFILLLLVLKMSSFEPNKVYLQEILLHYFIQKKSAAETHRILVETYDGNALLKTTYRKGF